MGPPKSILVLAELTHCVPGGAAQITQSELNAHWVFSMPPSDTGFNAQVREDRMYSMLNALRYTASVFVFNANT